MSGRAKRAALVLLVFLAAPNLSRGQASTSEIVGAIKDNANAMLPNASVVATSVDTGIQSSTESDSAGFFSIAGLQPGQYKVSVSAQGFERSETDVTLDVGIQRQVNFSLKPGSANETVIVTDAAPPVDLVSSTIQPVINQRTVVELPLNGRDWTQLTNLEPGVAPARTQPSVGLTNQRANRGLGNQISIAGSRPQQNNYRVDGISINDYSNGAPGGVIGAVLGVDAIQEFSVITSTSGADIGKTSGGVINAATRSGGSRWHGSAYEFLRNSALDARNEFDQPGQIAPFRRNQFGGTVGGPIWKDSTFIFGDYEGLRQYQSQNSSSIVPSPNARQGILSTGNITVNPAVAPFLTFYPEPNGPLSANGDTGSFVFNDPAITHENYFTIRADQALTQKDKLGGTYFYDNGNLTSPDPFDVRVTENIAKRQLATISETHTFSGSVMNSARFGYSRVVSIAPTTLNAINPAAANLAYGFIPGHYAGLINVGGLTNFQGGLHGTGEFDFHYNSYQFYDDVYWTKGLHSLQMGFSFERLQNNQLGTSNPNGQYVFPSLPAFLLNQPTSFNAPLSNGISPRDLRQSVFGVYFKDNYRILPNLMLNLGLRYEPASVPTETANRLALLPGLTATSPHLGSPYFSNPTYGNVSPRVGFAWDPFNKGMTSVRGGFGIYDSLPLNYLFEGLSIFTAPFLELGSIANLPAGTFPTTAYTLISASGLRYSYFQPVPPRSYVEQYNLTVQQELPGDFTVQLGYVGSHGVHLPYRVDDVNTTQPINLVGGYNFFNPNLCPAKVCTPAMPAPQKLNPQLGQISALFLTASSTYNAFTAMVTKALSHYTQGQISYTWAKSLDNGSSSTFGDTFNNSISSLPYWAPNRRYGLSDFNIGQYFVFNYLANTPDVHATEPIVRFLANGWQWNGIFAANGGQPFTPLISGDGLDLSSADPFDIADRVYGSGCGGNPVRPKNKNYVKTQCFVYPTYSNQTGITRLGFADRNSITGPGLATFDTAFIKNTRVSAGSETLNVQFRAEYFNLFNRVNYSDPPKSGQQLWSPPATPTVASPTTQPARLASGGVLVGPTATSSRQLQFGLKLIF